MARPALRALLISVFVSALVSIGGVPASALPPPPTEVLDASGAGAEPSVVFGAGGDLGANSHTTEALERLDSSAAEFFLALGDLDYDETSSDAAWCDYVRSHLSSKGPDFPFELVAGNHEADDGSDGRVARFAACLRDKLDARGAYARQYAFTYPAADPLIKVLMISPRLTLAGHTYDYRRGTADRRWLVRQLEGARDAGIPWVVVGMHYPCLSSGAGHPGCDAGSVIENLLLRERVDLVLTGHNHIYERSKQIELSAACPRVRPGRFDAACVSDTGRDDAYAAGAGTVQVTSGRVGGRYQGVNPGDPDRPWFVTSGGRTTGWTKLKVTSSRLTASYVNTSGSMHDSFVISR
ncbi:MAG: metallophosphoesterase [Nocardioides sp.]